MKESIFFLTYHKVASTMVGSTMLPNVLIYEHASYETRLYSGGNDTVDFELNGKGYGPIRLSLDECPIYERIIKPLIDSNQLHNSKLVQW